MKTLLNTQPPALQAEKLSEGYSNSPFEKLAKAMGFLEKRQEHLDGSILFGC